MARVLLNVTIVVTVAITAVLPKTSKIRILPLLGVRFERLLIDGCTVCDPLCSLRERTGGLRNRPSVRQEPD